MQKDPAVTIGNMRKAIDDTNVRLDLAVSPGVILMPSNMIILEKGVAGFNNILTIASTDTMSFGKNDVNEQRKVERPTSSTTSPNPKDSEGSAASPDSGKQKDRPSGSATSGSETSGSETSSASKVIPNVSLGSVVLLPTTVMLGVLIARYIL